MDKGGYEEQIIYEKLRDRLRSSETKHRIYDTEFISIERQITDARNNIGFNVYTPIQTHRRIVGKLLINWKRFVRRSVAWILNPLFYEQTVKNSRFTQILYEITDLQKKIDNDNSTFRQMLSRRIDELNQTFKKDLLETQNSVDLLKEDLNYLNRSIEGLRNNESAQKYKRTYAKTGEDVILLHIFRSLKRDSKLTYIDLGSECPALDNNTYLFYKHGSTGLLVQADAGKTDAFLNERPNDIVVCKGPAEAGHELLDELIGKYFNEKAPDLISIATVYLGLDVLKSVREYRPAVFIIEMPKRSNQNDAENIIAYLQSIGYEEYCHTGLHSIFVHQSVQVNG
jgi:hypothetical protein